MKKSKIATQLIAGFAANMAMVCAGFHYGWPSPALPKLLANDSNTPITSDESSWIVSFLTLGSVFGPLISTVLVNVWGRKLTLLSTVVPYLRSSILLCVAQSFRWLLVARFIAGFSCGIAYTVVPMYLGEISDNRIRGALGSMSTNMVFIGLLFSYSVGPWVSSVVFACAGGALPILFGLMFVWMPETPYFFMMIQKLDKAKKSLSYLRGTSDVMQELNEIQMSVENDQQNAGTFKELVMTSSNRKALVIAIGLIMAQQFSGILALLAYMSLIFDASGSTLNTSVSTIIIGVIQVSSGMVAIFTADSAGRKPLLMISVCGSITFLTGEALFFQLRAVGIDVSSITWLPVTCMVGYVIAFSIGLGCIPYVMVSELFPCNVKALASTTITIVGALSAITAIKLYQIIADGFGIHAAFWGFAVITVFSGLFIHFFVPETKQRSLRDIQDDLHDAVPLPNDRVYSPINK